MAYKTKEEQRAACRSHYARNKGYYLERNRKARAQKREWLKQYKSSLFCEICGEARSVCLDFHHPEGATKEFNISDIAKHNWSIKRMEDEISKCQVLCANCHRVLHYGGE